MLKSTHATLKLSHDEALQEEKIRIRNDEEKKQKELEDRLRTSASAREEAEVGRVGLFVDAARARILVTLQSTVDRQS